MLEMLVDNRIGGFPKYHLGKKGDLLVQLPNEIRKCVVFICRNTNSGMKFFGTAFFIREYIDKTNKIDYFDHLITAKHILVKLWEIKPNELVYLRINRKDNGYDLIDISSNQWQFHPDPFVDVAIIPFIKVPDYIDYLPYPLLSSATNDIVDALGIGIGDDIFLAGLFTRHTGTQKNIPIIRVGNIAAMPDEPIKTEMGDMEAYIVETRSVGGLSGSPVFAYLGGMRYFDDNKEPPEIFTSDDTLTGNFYLLGIMHGHWKVSKSDIDMFVEDNENNESVNMGLGIVVPISKIIETIKQSEVEKMKKGIIQKNSRKNLPVMDSNITREQFHNIVKKAAQPIKKEDTESKSASK
jgi:hypothetical protein